MKTTGKKKGEGMVRRAFGIVRSQGMFAIYNGISASLLRQLLLNIRFNIYEGRINMTSGFRALSPFRILEVQSEGVAERREHPLSEAGGAGGLRRSDRWHRVQPH